jgi:hypothetical protein
MEENIKFIAITNDDKEVELCVTNRDKLYLLNNIIDNMKLSKDGHVKEYIIKEDENIIRRRVKSKENIKEKIIKLHERL